MRALSLILDKIVGLGVEVDVTEFFRQNRDGRTTT